MGVERFDGGGAGDDDAARGLAPGGADAGEGGLKSFIRTDRQIARDALERLYELAITGVAGIG